jgi:hypothetical protein
VTRERGSPRDRHVVKNSRMCNCVDDVARAAEQDLWEKKTGFLSTASHFWNFFFFGVFSIIITIFFNYLDLTRIKSSETNLFYRVRTVEYHLHQRSSCNNKHLT